MGSGIGRPERQRYVPSGAGEQRVNEGRVQRGVLELLDERRLVESNTGRVRLGNDAFAFLDQLRCKSGGDEVSIRVSFCARVCVRGAWNEISIPATGPGEKKWSEKWRRTGM